MQPVSALCKGGHEVIRFCARSEHEPCLEMIDDPCSAGHAGQRKCFQKPGQPCKTCAIIAKEKKRLLAIADADASKRSEELAKFELARVQACARLESEQQAREHQARIQRLKNEERLLMIEVAAERSRTKRKFSESLDAAVPVDTSLDQSDSDEQLVLGSTAPASHESVPADSSLSLRPDEIVTTLESLESSLLEPIVLQSVPAAASDISTVQESSSSAELIMANLKPLFVAAGKQKWVEVSSITLFVLHIF